MARNELVSVIVPVYNAEKYLEKCVESIIKQSYDNIEIILVDDGSTDSSGCVCDELSKKYSSVFAYHKCNEGESLTRAYGVKKAKGELIAWVDSDDWIEPDYIEKMTAKMRVDKEIDIALGLFIQNDLDGNIISIQNKREPYYLSREEALIELFEVEKWGGGSCVKVMRRVVYNEFEPTRMVKLGSDLVNSIRIINKSRRLYYTGECLYHYITNPNSQCNNFSTENQINYLRFYDNYSHRDEVKSNKRLDAAVKKRAWGAYQYALSSLVEKPYTNIREILKQYDIALRPFMSEVLLNYPINDPVWDERRKRYGDSTTGLVEYYDYYWDVLHNAEQLYIFGAGDYGLRASKILLDNKADFKGFVISDGQPIKNKTIEQKPVCNVSDLKVSKSDITILVGLDEEHTRQLYDYILSIGFKKIMLL